MGRFIGARGGFLAASVGLMACGGEEAPPVPAPAAPPVVTQACPEGRRCDFPMEVGVGLYEMTVPSPGDVVPLVEGVQGGFHIWLAARCWDCADQVEITFGVREELDGAWFYDVPIVGISNLTVRGEVREKTGLYGLMPGTPDDPWIVGLPAVLDVTIRDGERTSSRVLDVVVGEPEYWDCPTSDPTQCE